MSDNFDIDFSALPPELRLKLWVLALDADTGKVNLAYKKGAFKTALSYSYGGAISASAGIRRFNGRIGISPVNGDVDLGLVFKGYRFGANVSPSKGSGGASFGYGAALLPFPAELEDVFGKGGAAATRLAPSIPSAVDNPLAWYGLRSNDVSAISKAINAGRKIYKAGAPGGKRFGAGLRLNYDKTMGLTIYGGALLRF